MLLALHRLKVIKLGCLFLRQSRELLLLTGRYLIFGAFPKRTESKTEEEDGKKERKKERDQRQNQFSICLDPIWTFV